MTNDDAPTQRLPADAVTTRGGYAAGQKIFSRYLLEAQIGRGGMGVVWRARDEKLERTVALKFLPPEVAADAEAVRDLKLETRRCLDLTHLNIVRVYDFIEEPEGAAIAMEYVEGESLAKIKAAAPGGCLAAADLTPYVAQLCAALRYAHHVAKVAHHDLKPANVLVTREGILKVTDFGIARSLTDTQTRLTAKIGATSGTLLYMSPQQLAGDKPTVSDDIYALGTLLYELLTGKPPFFRGDPLSLRQQVFERAPAPLEAHRRDVGCTGAEIPAEWSATILACLAKKAEDRPASVDEVAAGLGVSLEPLTTSRSGGLFPTTAGRASARPADAPPAPRRSAVPWLISVGLAVIALAGGGIYYEVYVVEPQRTAAEEREREAEVALRRERVRQVVEQKRAEEEKRQQAAALAAEQKKKDEEARAQQERDQAAFKRITASIASLSELSTPRQRQNTMLEFRSYAQTAPKADVDEVQKRLDERLATLNQLAAQRRPGSLVVESEPSGATVTLYPRNERRTTPALFEDVKPGDVTLRVEKEGFEAKDVPFVVKPGATNKLDGPVKLAALFGSLAITSTPLDLLVTVEGPNGKKLDGRTPFDAGSLAPGEYKVTFLKRGWLPQTKAAVVERGKSASVTIDMRGVDVIVRTVPAGAQVTIENQVLGTLDKPLELRGIQPRDYQITAALDGYEPYNRTVPVKRNDTVTISLTEKPLPRTLKRLAGARWRYESFTTSVELAFTPKGAITCTHHAGLGGTARDTGVAESFNANTATLHARFAANQGRPYFTGNVQIKIVDDDHLSVTWNAGGSPEHLLLERDKGQK